MRQHMVRGAAIAISLALVAAACSSSHKKGESGGTTTTTASGSTTTPGSSTTGTGTLATVPPTNPGDTTSSGPPSTSSVTPGTTTVPPSTTPLTQPPFNTVWKLALDYRTHPGTNPFASNRGGVPAWSLRESSSLARNGNYTLLPAFSSTFGTTGLAAWHDNTSGCHEPPMIGANTVDGSMPLCGAQIPGNAAFAYPGKTRMPVVDFTSPFEGTARISAGVADVDPGCGDGVRFYIDRGTTSLSAITLTNMNAVRLPAIRTHVTVGQSLYFIVDAGAAGNDSCDTTQLQIEIDKAP